MASGWMSQDWEMAMKGCCMAMAGYIDCALLDAIEVV